MEFQKIGIGTYKLKEEKECKETIHQALKMGYRLIDTASFYDNEDYIGEVITQYKRDEIGLTTKIWPRNFNAYDAEISIEKSLKALKTNYIDLFLIHWPSRDYEKVWKILEKYHDEKVFHKIGVCNFEKKHLEFLEKTANIKPFLNQIETHLLMQQKDLHAYLEDQGIIHQAWSPLARGSNKLLHNKDLISIAKNKGKSPGQIALRYLLQKNIYIIPKSTTKEHMKENLELEDFTLSDTEMKCLQNMDEKLRISKDPNDETWLSCIREGVNYEN